MAELINLNRARKRKDKEAATKRADMNRLKFGRTTSEKARIASDAGRSAKMLDQHKLSEGDAT